VTMMATLLAQKSDYKAQFHMVFKQDQRAGEDLETRTKDFDSLTRLNRQENARKRNHAANLERTLTDTRGVVKSQGAALSKLRSEVKAQGAFWKVYQYPTRRRGQSEKSPYLIARRLVKRIPPTSPAHDQFLVLIVGLIAVLIVFLAAVGRSEWRKANQFREELRKRRSAKGLGLGTPPSPPADPPTEAPEP